MKDKFINHKKILYVDMDNVLVDFKSGIEKISKKIQIKYRDKLDEVPGIFRLMKPMPLAIKSYKKLIKKYDVYILSTAPWENHSAWSDKLWWIQKYLGNKIAYKNLIITHHKELNIGNFLIDDRYKNGAREFTGKHIKFNSKNRNEWCRILKILNIK